MSPERRRGRRKARDEDATAADAAGGSGASGVDDRPTDPAAVLEGLLADVTEPRPAADTVDEPSTLDAEPVWRDSGDETGRGRPAGSMGDPPGRPAGTAIGSPLGPTPDAVADAGSVPDAEPDRHARRIDPIVEAAALGAPVDAAGAASDRPTPTRRQRRADKRRSDELVAAATAGSTSASAAGGGGAGAGRAPTGADAGDDGGRRTRRMRAFRFPALLIVIALVAAGFFIERRVTPPIAEVTTGAALSRAMPTATAADAVSSTWFCAGGTAVGEPSSAPKDIAVAGPAPARATGAALRVPEVAAQAPGTTAKPGPPGTSGTAGTPGTTAVPPPKVTVVAEQSITIANGSDHGQAAKVTVYPSEGTPTVRVVDLAGHSRAELRLSDVVKAPYASALVESDGGLVSVEQALQGPNGRSVGPCASSPSASWYFAAGSTRLGTREIFVAFNPFPASAVLDFSFQVEEEGGRQASRDSDKLKGQLVPANGVVAFDVTDIITVRNQLSTVVRTRGGEGRVVVSRLLVSDGTSGQPKSVNMNLGAPTPMSTWLFADGPVFEPGVQTSYVVYNPGSTTLQAAVSVQPDAQRVGLDVAPFEVNVRPGQFEVVPVTNARVPSNSGYWVSVQSRSGAGFVAERVVQSDPPASRPGVSYTLGSPLVATRWQVPAAGVAGQTSGQISIANVAASDPVTLTLLVERGGTSEVLTVFDHVELAAGRRTALDLSTLGANGADPTASVTVEATGPVIVERTLGFTDPAAVSDAIAIPVRTTLALPPDDLFDRLGTALPPGGATVPPGTFVPVPGSVPGSGPGSIPGSVVPVGPPGTDGIAPVDGGTLPPGAVPDGALESTTTTVAVPVPTQPGLVPPTTAAPG